MTGPPACSAGTWSPLNTYRRRGNRGRIAPVASGTGPAAGILPAPAVASTMSELVVSFGGAHQARVTRISRGTWEEFAAFLTAEPPEAGDKAERGWYCPAEFRPAYRDSDNFVARYAITFDFDHVEASTWDDVYACWGGLDYAIYTTFSHTPEKPRFRVVLPLDRPVTYDEYQAISRKLAADIGIELVARESFVPSQMMYLPTRKPGAEFIGHVVEGERLKADDVLAEYADWTDKSQWPHRESGDGVHAISEEMTPPTEKPGIIGEFCRAFTVPAAVERFDLPYKPTATEGRWTYTAGSRPEGAIVYDGGLKLHSHHDTDPARGQHNAFDLVRLHKFGQLDAEASADTVVTELPSYAAMARLAREQPEIKNSVLESFSDLGPVTLDVVMPAAPEVNSAPTPASGAPALAHPLSYKLANPTVPEWLLPDLLERGVIAIMAGQRGSYKSFLALDMAMRVALDGEPVYVVSAEGSDFDRRAAAWLRHNAPEQCSDEVPLFVAERRLDLNTHDGVELIRQDCLRLGIRPKLFVLDTFSKLSGGLDENSNTEVKAFIGRLAAGLQRADTGFGATVLLIAHTGHSETGRARGASALGADTDAEYVVARLPGGGVSLSRERFKSSPELPPLAFQPKIVDLGRQDALGGAITSLVMVEADDRPQGASVRLSGPVQKMVYDFLRTQPGAVRDKDVVRAVVERMSPPPEGERDRREHAVRRTINNMVAAGSLQRPVEGQIGLTRAVPVDVEETDEWTD